MFISGSGEAQKDVWNNAGIKRSYKDCDNIKTKKYIRTVLIILPAARELDLFLSYGGVEAGLDFVNALATRCITATEADSTTKENEKEKEKEKGSVVRAMKEVLHHWKNSRSNSDEPTLFVEALKCFQIVDSDTESDVAAMSLLGDFLQTFLITAKNNVFTKELATELVKAVKSCGLDRLRSALEPIVARSTSPSLVIFGTQFVLEIVRQDLSDSSSIRDRILNAATKCLSQQYSVYLAELLCCLAFELKDLQLMSSLVDQLLAYYHSIKITTLNLARIPLHLLLEELSKSLTMQQLLRTPYHRLVLALIAQLEAIVKPGPPVFSWSMPLARFPGYPDIEKFFHSNEQHSFFPFSKYTDAKSFAFKCSMQKKTGYSAKIVAPVRVDKNARVEITKNPIRHQKQVAKFEVVKKQLEKLRSELSIPPSDRLSPIQPQPQHVGEKRTSEVLETSPQLTNSPAKKAREVIVIE